MEQLFNLCIGWNVGPVGTLKGERISVVEPVGILTGERFIQFLYGRKRDDFVGAI